MASGISTEEWAVALISLVLTAFVNQGIGEELLLRDYLLRSARMPMIPALLVSAVAFAIPHLLSVGGQEGIAQRFLYLLPAFAFGLLAGILAVHFKSVWAACGVHGGFHVGGFITDALGWGQSPWIWVFQTLVFVLASIPLIAMVSKQKRDQVLDPYV